MHVPAIVLECKLFHHYVGNDYYCETGDNSVTPPQPHEDVLFPNDLLWDGQQCPGVETPCCNRTMLMTWFNKTLSETTTEDIELRVCGGIPVSFEDTPLDLIELFVR